MVLNKVAATAITVSPLAVFGIDMDVPSFTAGMLLSVPAYFVGREVWKEQSTIGLWAGLCMALFGALLTAMSPDTIPYEATTQFKMVAVALGFTLVIAWLRNKGKKWSKADDTDS